MSHWQYLSHVEPVLPTPRTGSPAQVQTDLPALPPRLSAFVVAVFTAISTFVPAPTQAVTPTGWYPQMAEPVPAVTRLATYETGAERPLEIPRSQHITWQPRLDLPPSAARRVSDFATGADRPTFTPPPAAATFIVPPLLGEVPQRARGPVTTDTGAESPVFVAPPAIAVFVPPMLDGVPLRARQAVTTNTGAESPILVPPPPVSTLFVPPLLEIGTPRARRVVIGETGAEDPVNTASGVPDLTGTVTVILKMRSADATATQTCKLHLFTIRKVTP